MHFFRRISAFFAAVTIILTAGSAAGETLKPVTDSRGRPPAVFMLEGPHLALKTWQEKKFEGKTVIFFGSGLGILRYNDEATATLLKEMRSGGWDDLFEKAYPTSVFYPVGPSSYLYLARKAGMVGKVYWIPPTKGLEGNGSDDDAKSFLSALGFDERNILIKKTAPAYIEAELNDVPVFICGLKDLPRIKEEAVLIIDLSFFPPFYQDEVKTPFLDMFGGFLKTLGLKSPKISSVFIAASTGNGQVPLEYRFIGGYLKTFFREPGKLKDGPLPAWEFRSSGMYYNTFFQYEEQFENYSQGVKHAPRDASLHYDLSKVYLYKKDITGIKKHLDKAVSLDRGYYLQYIETGRIFLKKGMLEDAEVFMNEAGRINPDDPRIYEAFHDLYAEWGRHAEDVEALGKMLSLGFEGPKIYGSLGDAYKKMGEFEKAGENYEKALSYIPQVDIQSRASLLLGLADTRASQKKPAEAIKLYEEALAGMPEEGHARDRVIEKLDSLWNLWAPFLEPSNQAPSEPSSSRP